MIEDNKKDLEAILKEDQVVLLEKDSTYEIIMGVLLDGERLPALDGIELAPIDTQDVRPSYTPPALDASEPPAHGL